MITNLSALKRMAPPQTTRGALLLLDKLTSDETTRVLAVALQEAAINGRKRITATDIRAAHDRLHAQTESYEV